MIALKVAGEVVEEQRSEGEIWVYLSAFYTAEETIAEKITILNRANNIKKIPHLEKELKKIEKQTDMELSEKQKEAIEAVNENNVCIITGGPGTGKTTIIKTIIELYKAQGKKTVLCAPTRTSCQTYDRDHRRRCQNIT